jgi:hypothetical protein
MNEHIQKILFIGVGLLLFVASASLFFQKFNLLDSYMKASYQTVLRDSNTLQNDQVRPMESQDSGIVVCSGTTVIASLLQNREIVGGKVNVEMNVDGKDRNDVVIAEILPAEKYEVVYHANSTGTIVEIDYQRIQ